MNENTNEKYFTRTSVNGQTLYLARTRSGEVALDKDDWERHKATDDLLRRTPEYIQAHGDPRPIRGRDPVTGEPIYDAD